MKPVSFLKMGKLHLKFVFEFLFRSLPYKLVGAHKFLCLIRWSLIWFCLHGRVATSLHFNSSGSEVLLMTSQTTDANRNINLREYFPLFYAPHHRDTENDNESDNTEDDTNNDDFNWYSKSKGIYSRRKCGPPIITGIYPTGNRQFEPNQEIQLEPNITWNCNGTRDPTYIWRLWLSDSPDEVLGIYNTPTLLLPQFIHPSLNPKGEHASTPECQLKGQNPLRNVVDVERNRSDAEGETYSVDKRGSLGDLTAFYGLEEMLAMRREIKSNANSSHKSSHKIDLDKISGNKIFMADQLKVGSYTAQITIQEMLSQTLSTASFQVVFPPMRLQLLGGSLRYINDDEFFNIYAEVRVPRGSWYHISWSCESLDADTGDCFLDSDTMPPRFQTDHPLGKYNSWTSDHKRLFFDFLNNNERQIMYGDIFHKIFSIVDEESILNILERINASISVEDFLKYLRDEVRKESIVDTDEKRNQRSHADELWTETFYPERTKQTSLMWNETNPRAGDNSDEVTSSKLNISKANEDQTRFPDEKSNKDYIDFDSSASGYRVPRQHYATFVNMFLLMLNMFSKGGMGDRSVSYIETLSIPFSEISPAATNLFFKVRVIDIRQESISHQLIVIRPQVTDNIGMDQTIPSLAPFGATRKTVFESTCLSCSKLDLRSLDYKWTLKTIVSSTSVFSSGTDSDLERNNLKVERNHSKVEQSPSTMTANHSEVNETNSFSVNFANGVKSPSTFAEMGEDELSQVLPLKLIELTDVWQLRGHSHEAYNLTAYEEQLCFLLIHQCLLTYNELYEWSIFLSSQSKEVWEDDKNHLNVSICRKLVLVGRELFRHGIKLSAEELSRTRHNLLESVSSSAASDLSASGINPFDAVDAADDAPPGTELASRVDLLLHKIIPKSNVNPSPEIVSDKLPLSRKGFKRRPLHGGPQMSTSTEDEEEVDERMENSIGLSKYREQVLVAENLEKKSSGKNDKFQTIGKSQKVDAQSFQNLQPGLDSTEKRRIGDESSTGFKLVKVPGFSQMTTTGTNQPLLVMYTNALDPDSQYILILETMNRINGKRGKAIQHLQFSPAPLLFGCKVVEVSKNSLSGGCSIVEGLYYPVKLMFSYHHKSDGPKTAFYLGSLPSIEFTLPSGLEVNNYTMYVSIEAVDGKGIRTSKECHRVKVEPRFKTNLGVYSLFIEITTLHPENPALQMQRIRTLGYELNILSPTLICRIFDNLIAIFVVRDACQDVININFEADSPKSPGNYPFAPKANKWKWFYKYKARVARYLDDWAQNHDLFVKSNLLKSCARDQLVTSASNIPIRNEVEVLMMITTLVILSDALEDISWLTFTKVVDTMQNVKRHHMWYWNLQSDIKSEVALQYFILTSILLDKEYEIYDCQSVPNLMINQIVGSLLDVLTKEITSRFLEEKPIAYESGSLNAYAFVTKQSSWGYYFPMDVSIEESVEDSFSIYTVLALLHFRSPYNDPSVEINTDVLHLKISCKSFLPNNRLQISLPRSKDVNKRDYDFRKKGSLDFQTISVYSFDVTHSDSQKTLMITLEITKVYTLISIVMMIW